MYLHQLLHLERVPAIEIAASVAKSAYAGFALRSSVCICRGVVSNHLDYTGDLIKNRAIRSQSHTIDRD